MYVVSVKNRATVRHSSYQKAKAHRVGLRMHRVWKLHAMSSVM